ncbi:MAG: hypothetical protein H0U44_05940, partial [Flavisolibacter sp.]|nr:hypothetical protein [Flavisolibacter sp.]
MRFYGILLVSFLFVKNGIGQPIKTLLPPKPVIVGTAFQVQFIIAQPENFKDYIVPDFEGFT